MQKPPGPVSLTERIETIDIIRGIALCGIVIVNFTVDRGLTEPWKGFTGSADQTVFWTITFFMNDKFMAIYCFLFGLGFAIQLQRAQLLGTPFLSVYIRRILVLFLIGSIHQILTNTSVLPQYAMVAVILLMLHRLPSRLFPIMALICFLIPSITDFVTTKDDEPIVNPPEILIDPAILDANIIGVYEREGEPGRYNIITRVGSKVYSQGRGGTVRLIALSDTEFRVEDRRDRFVFLKDSTGTVNKLEIQPDGLKSVSAMKIQKEVEQAQKEMLPTYSKSVSANASALVNRLGSWDWWRNFFWYSALIQILPLFLLGLYAGQRNIFQNVAVNRRFLKNTTLFALAAGGLCIGIPLGFRAWNFFHDIDKASYSPFTQELIRFLENTGIMTVAIGYVAGLVLILENAQWKSRLAILAPVGTMGLTNYLLQSFFLVIVIDNGLHLNGMIGPFWRLVITVPALSIILVFSHWWFKRFRMGPAEWIWRSLTYWKIQPLRLNVRSSKTVKT